MANINEILAALKAQSEKNAFGVYVPSLKRELKFKPLTGKQQKSFYGCLADNIAFRTKFILLTYDIIKENCLEPETVDILTVLDRSVILLALRKNILGDGFVLEKDNTQYTASIDVCLKTAESIDIPAVKTIAIQDLEYVIGVPTIKEQYQAEKELREGDKENTVPIEQLVKDVLFTEASKFIKEIYFVAGSNKVPFEYNNLTFKERISVIEALPADTLIEIQRAFNEVDTLQTKILTVVLGEGMVSTFDITPDFFLEG